MLPNGEVGSPIYNSPSLPVAGGPRSQDWVVALVAASRGNAAGEKKLAASVVQKGLAGRGGPEATR